jgi:lipooligosaccharide transport system ATP-binding protein
MPAIIRTENLEKSFASLQAVAGISFSVEPGECFGLLGPNGAGKTTTIRMLYGYTPIGSGTLEVFGLDVRKEIRAIKQRIGICQQEDSLDPDLSVRDNLIGYARYFSLPTKVARQRADELLAFFALEKKAGSSIRTLSGGLKRRLMLARALINNPELLILDEPTTGLDPQSRQLLWERLASLKARGLTVLLTTHYMEEAARLCDRLVIVDHGKVLIEGRPAELVRREIGSNVLEVLEPDQAVREFLRQHGSRFEEAGERLLVHLDDGDELFLRLPREVRREGCTLRPATLEDLFLKLTGRELRE